MIIIKNKLRTFDKWRREKMRNLEPILYKLVKSKNPTNDSLIERDHIKNIIILRNNKRIGNVCFWLPFVKQVRLLYPYAHITVMLNKESQGEILRNIGIDELLYSKFSFKNCIYFLSLLKQLKFKNYDLILVPKNSVEDSMICSFLNGINKVSSKNIYRNNAYSHTFSPTNKHTHAALTTLYLLEEIGNKLIKPLDHTLNLTNKEVNSGKKEKSTLCSKADLTIAFFRGARGDKRLSNKEWLGIIEKLEVNYNKKIQWVEILSPDIKEPLIGSSLTYSNRNMRMLASFLRNMDAFISCDTGPLHLADAANVRCMGLYNKTDPKIFGLLNKKSIEVDLLTFNASKILKQISL
ncbi:glycosyltransferase family 9 protein [Vibrio harveyi]